MTRPGYGEFAIDPKGLIDYRKSLGAEDILILADIQVKYATMINPRPLAESARLACEENADALVVTGGKTGDARCHFELFDRRRNDCNGRHRSRRRHIVDIDRSHWRRDRRGYTE